jgi:methionine synthase I (cobalamin-dependent)
MSFLSALSSGPPLLMDGAMGSGLLAAGFRCPERACLEGAGRVRGIHAGYVESGARVLLTNTFQLNPVALARHGLEQHLETIGRKALLIARSAAPGAWVLGDVGPMFSPGGGVEFQDRAALARVLAALEGADGILFETCSGPAALSAVQYALHRIPEEEGVPLLLSLSYHRDGAGNLVTCSGHGPETYARHAARHGVAALGVNCGREVDVADACAVLRRYREHTDLPLFARPNAGTPDAGGRYPRTAEQMAAGVPALVEAGARMIGGCCGTTRGHIAAFAEALAAPSPSSGQARTTRGGHQSASPTRTKAAQ